jgi:integrase
MGSIRERATGKGKVFYDAEVKRRGLPKAYKTFSRLTDARCWIQDIESDMRAGKYQPQAEAQRHTLADAIDRFIREESPKGRRSFVDQKRQLLYFHKRIGFRLLCETTPAVLSELKSKFLTEDSRYSKKRQPQTWNRYHSALSRVFEMCRNDWQWMDDNPLRRVRREREVPGRVRFLSDEERETLLRACEGNDSPNLYPAVVLALSTGMRRGEVKGLTWDQVDLAKGVILLNETKNKERRRVAVRGLALDLLRAHAKVRRIDTNFVFSGSKTQFTGQPFDLDNYWAHAVKTAGLNDFRFHDLRHSCASYLAMNGASLLEIAEVLGHKTLQMVRRYSHLAESHTAEVVEKMNRKIFGTG